MEVTIVFPHQLFRSHPAIEVDRPILLLEHPLFFFDARYDIRFHKQKLLLHRASMKAFSHSLQHTGYQVQYISFEDIKEDYSLEALFVSKGIKILHMVDPVDYDLRKLIGKSCLKLGIERIESDSPNFINTIEESAFFFNGKKRMFMADFYKYQRKRLGIMLDDSLQPWGGKWSFDLDNRKKIPKKELGTIPSIPKHELNAFIEEGKKYVRENFPDHPGSMEEFKYGITHDEAEQWLSDFLSQRFSLFGPYEDAIVEEETYLYHGVLTPMLNIGLLDPMEIIRKALDHYEHNEIPMSSLEGFIRQILGWREFIRYSYERYGVQMRTTNHWKHHRKIPASFYTAETGIKPLDVSIKRALDFAYCHHIERLMVLGGFMFICEFDPDDIYKWFMEMFIDSYDWVMVPNVYAMSQHADGGLITTKPYFSGSNYVRKMSHYKAGAWADVWDGLYWNFIFKHSEELKRNPRWSMMVRTSEKMDPEKREKHLTQAASFLSSL